MGNKTSYVKAMPKHNKSKINWKNIDKISFDDKNIKISGEKDGIVIHRFIKFEHIKDIKFEFPFICIQYNSLGQPHTNFQIRIHMSYDKDSIALIKEMENIQAAITIRPS